MDDTVKLLFKIVLALIGGGAVFIMLNLVVFTGIMFLVPTSSPNQAEEWTKTVVPLFGINVAQIWIERLKVAALGVSLIVPLGAIAWFSFWLLNKQR